MTMVLGRFKEAVSDAAETLRRVFSSPDCRSVPTRLSAPEPTGLALLEAVCVPADYRFEPGLVSQELQLQPVLKVEATGFAARLCGEAAWATWVGGAKLLQAPLFSVGAQGRISVPPLPRTAAIRKPGLPPFRPSTRILPRASFTAAVQGGFLRILAPRTRRNVEVVLGLPISIAGESFQSLPRALNTRYTLHLVKATGENIRNLDVLGVFPVPTKGVLSLRHDARSGRLLVNLGPEAAGAPMGRFILARKKSDHGFVSCYVEE